MPNASDTTAEQIDATSWPGWKQHLSRLIVLVVLGLLFFRPLLLHPTELLYSPNSDLLSLHVL